MVPLLTYFMHALCNPDFPLVYIYATSCFLDHWKTEVQIEKNGLCVFFGTNSKMFC